MGETTKPPWDLPPGLDLDAAVGRALGLEPRIEWGASRDGGESFILTTASWGAVRSKADLETWVEEQNRDHPESITAGCEILKIECWSAFSTEDDAAMWAAKRLVERGLRPSVFHDTTWGCAIRRLGSDGVTCEMCQIDEDPDSPALAISRAIMRAADLWPELVRGEGEA